MLIEKIIHTGSKFEGYTHTHTTPESEIWFVHSGFKCN